MENLINKIELKLQELGIIKQPVIVDVKLADEVEDVNDEDVNAEITSQIVSEPIDISYTIVGEPVNQIVKEGEDVIIVEDGTYELTDKTVIVIVDGKLSEVTPTVEENEDEDEDVKLATIEKNRISDIVDLNQNGSYTISLEVFDGEIIWGDLYTSTWENLIMAEETKATEKVDELTLAFETKMSEEAEKYENIIEALKTGETKMEIDESPLKLSEIEIFKLQLAEKRKNNK